MVKWTVGADRNLPISDSERAWDGAEAKARVFAWAGWPDSPNPAKARRAFLVYDAENAENKSAYKLPFADIGNGRLEAIPAALRAAASRLPQADLPQDVKDRARGVLDGYFERMRGKSKALRVKVKIPAGIESPARPQERAKRAKAWDGLYGPGHLVLGVPFGGPKNGRDSDGEAFHAGTEIWLKMGDTVPITYYHGFGPDDPREWQDPPAIIGAAKLVRADERGYWFEARYDLTEPLAKRVLSAPVTALRASSGAVAHLVRVRGDGMIDTWPVGELAVFDINEWRQPANDYAVVIPAKAEQAEAVAEAGEPAKATAEQREAEAETKSEIKPDEGALPETEGKTVDEKEIKAKEAEQEQPETPALDVEALVAQVKAAATEAATEAVKALAAEPPINAGAVKAEVGKRVMVNTGTGKGDGYKAKFDRFLHNEEVKGLTEGGAAVALVPPEYGDELLTDISEGSIFRLAGAQVRTQRARTADWPYLGLPTSAGREIAEEGTYGTATPSTTDITATLYKYGKILPVSEEFWQDSRFDVFGEILRPYFAEFFTVTENEKFTSGNGTTAPQGITNVSNTVVAAAAAALAKNDIISTYHGLDYRFRRRGVWMMHDSTAQAIMELEDSNGRPLWFNSLAEGQPPTLLGHPVITNNHLPEIGASNKVIVFGDFNYYWIFQHPDTIVQRLYEKYADTGQIGFRMGRRFDGRIMNNDAFVILQMAAA